VGRLWRESDCEELVGLLTGDDVTDLAMSISVWSVYCRKPSELYFTRKMSKFPELVFPLSPPFVYPVT